MNSTLWSRLTPWIYCPFLALTSCEWSGLENLRLDPAWLLLPAAVLLGRRHGWQGAAALVIGAVGALAFTLVDSSRWQRAPDTGWLLLVVLVGMHAAGLLSLERIGTALRTRPMAWLVLPLLLLQFALLPPDDALSLWPRSAFVLYRVELSWLFWTVLIVAGRARVEWSALLPLTAVVFALWVAHPERGWSLATLFGAGTVELPVLGRTALDVVVLNVKTLGFGALATMFACFGLGRWVARAEETGWSPGSGRVTVVLGVVAVVAGIDAALGWKPLHDLASDFGMRSNGLRGALMSPVSGPLLLLLAGLWRGPRAVAKAALFLFILHIPWHEMPKVEPVAVINLALSSVVQAAAFGGCGALWRQGLGLPPPAKPGGHLRHALVLLASLLALLPKEEQIEDEMTALRVLVAVVAVAAVVASLVWLRSLVVERRRPRGWESNYEGWLATLALVAAGSAIAENLAQLRQLGTELGQMPAVAREWWSDNGDDDLRFALVAGFFNFAALAVSLWMLLSSLNTAVRKLRANWRDLRRAASRVAGFFGAARLAARLALPPPGPAPESETSAAPAATPARWRQALARAGRFAAMAVGLVVFLTVAISSWREDSIVVVDETLEEIVTSDAPPTPRPPDIHLAQAAREFLTREGHPLMPAEDRTAHLLLSGWREEPGEPARRRRYLIEVGPALEDFHLRVVHQVEERRRGLWFGRLPALGREEEEAAGAAKKSILHRARELATAAGGD